MSDLTNITAVFATVSTVFKPIAHKHNDADLQRLNAVLVVCCLSVALMGTSTGCPSGVVPSDTVYKLSHTNSFNFMRDTLEEYHPVIALFMDDVTSVDKTCLMVMEHE